MDYNESYVSKILYVAKVFAIMTVITAHMPFESNIFIETLFFRVSTIGVVVFLFISGYYFNVDKYKNIIDFFKKKITSIIIPWYVTGSIVWLHAAINGREILSLDNYLGYLVGGRSYLYYLTILMLCYLIYFYLDKYRSVYVISIILSLISIVLTALGLLDIIIDSIGISIWLNIFNWIGYFSLGALARKYKLEKNIHFLEEKRITIIVLNVIILLISILIEPGVEGYWFVLAVILEPINIVTIIAISTVKSFHNKVFYKIAKLSFSIYLTHFLVIGIVRTLIPPNEFIVWIYPLIVFGVNILLLLVGEYVFEKINLKNLYSTLVGLR